MGRERSRNRYEVRDRPAYDPVARVTSTAGGIVSGHRSEMEKAKVVAHRSTLMHGCDS
jgi:hypothetical protein